jgi:DNA-binding response OmpR family regulator
VSIAKSLLSLRRKRDRLETILLIEDDSGLRLALTKTLRAAGYTVRALADGASGLEDALAHPPDIVLLDVMLPSKNGFEVCRELREKDADLPIVMVTAKGEEADKVFGFKVGADDYIVKPFGTSELLARIDAALRRRRLTLAESQPLVVGELTIDPLSHTATRQGHPVELTAQELKLLRFFLRNQDRVVSRQRIIDAVWGADYFGTERTVDNFVTRLRAKMEPDPKHPTIVITVRGVGYRFSRGDKTMTRP